MNIAKVERVDKVISVNIIYRRMALWQTSAETFEVRMQPQIRRLNKYPPQTHTAQLRERHLVYCVLFKIVYVQVKFQ